MKKYLLIAICWTFLLAENTYEEICDNIDKNYKKTVTFHFPYSGVRRSVSRAMVRRGFKDDAYTQLNADDLKLALLVSNESRAIQVFDNATKGAQIICIGKIKKLNARNGGDFYYLIITSAKILEEKSLIEESQENSDDKILRIENIKKNTKNFVGRLIKDKVTFLKTTNFKGVKGKKFTRILSSQKMTLIFATNDRVIKKILKRLNKKSQITISGVVQEIQVKNKTKYVVEVSEVTVAKVIENKVVPGREFRRNRRRRNRNE